MSSQALMPAVHGDSTLLASVPRESDWRDVGDLPPWKDCARHSWVYDAVDVGGGIEGRRYCPECGMHHFCDYGIVIAWALRATC